MLIIGQQAETPEKVNSWLDDLFTAAAENPCPTETMDLQSLNPKPLNPKQVLPNLWWLPSCRKVYLGDTLLTLSHVSCT